MVMTYRPHSMRRYTNIVKVITHMQIIIHHAYAQFAHLCASLKLRRLERMRCNRVSPSQRPARKMLGSR
jgi:hypothetical protein